MGVTINILLDSNVLVLNNVNCIVKYLLHLKSQKGLNKTPLKSSHLITHQSLTISGDLYFMVLHSDMGAFLGVIWGP